MDADLPPLPLPVPAGASLDHSGTVDDGAERIPPRIETVIDHYLAEQAAMTPVERFARHNRDTAIAARRYRDLVPATTPGAGEQYAFDVDLDACTGCKACVTACRNLNGLDDGESWRSVGLVVGPAEGAHQGGSGQAVLQHVTTACHHCVEPGCLKGCPVDAYHKDPRTGIVHHSPDRCIGCGYCIFTCPYEVPRYNRDRGVVRKCDLCAGRLAAGEAPACAQACPTQAITVRVVAVTDARTAAASPWPLPSPRPSQTVPTTTYRTSTDLSRVEAADIHALRPQRPHPPLAVMLVLTQVAVGTYLADLAARWRPATGGGSPGVLPGAVAAVAVAVVALSASLSHLGRPHLAHRAVTGLRHSWLSREIVAFGAFAALATAESAAGVAGLDALAAQRWLPAAAASAGLAGVACSAMIYAVTGRRWWRLRTTALRFSSTTAVGGLTAALLSAAATGCGGTGGCRLWPLALALAGVVAAKLGAEGALLVRHRGGSVTSELPRTARLLVGELRTTTRWRFALGLLGGVVLPPTAAALAAGGAAGAATAAATGAAVGTVSGELIERWQFFTAESSRRMPGGVA